MQQKRRKQLVASVANLGKLSSFDLKPDYFDANRMRMNANLAFYDGLDGKIDWLFNGDRPSAAPGSTASCAGR